MFKKCLKALFWTAIAIILIISAMFGFLWYALSVHELSIVIQGLFIVLCIVEIGALFMVIVMANSAIKSIFRKR